MRAIDADHLKRWILSRVFQTQLSVADVIDQIDREDTIEPEIIRCKDCKYRGGFSGFYCDIVEKAVGADSFCSWAERISDDLQ